MTSWIDFAVAYLDDVRKIRQTGTSLGNDYLCQKVEDRHGCKVGQTRRVRPNLKL
jgi:hypothetical protein